MFERLTNEVNCHAIFAIFKVLQSWSSNATVCWFLATLFDLAILNFEMAEEVSKESRLQLNLVCILDPVFIK